MNTHFIESDNSPPEIVIDENNAQLFSNINQRQDVHSVKSKAEQRIKIKKQNTWWTNPLIFDLNLNPEKVFNAMFYTIVGSVSVFFGIPLIGGRVVVPKFEHRDLTVFSQLLVPEKNEILLKEPHLSNELIDSKKRQSILENKIDFLIQSVENIKPISNHSIEIGVQAFVGLESNINTLQKPAAASTAENFDAATGIIEPSSVQSSSIPKPVTKIGLYVHVPLFRK